MAPVARGAKVGPRMIIASLDVIDFRRCAKAPVCHLDLADPVRVLKDFETNLVPVVGESVPAPGRLPAH